MNNFPLNEYGRWISQTNWTYFTTLTTQRPMSLASSRKALERFNNRLGKYGDITILWVAEKFKLIDSYHSHCLIQCPKTLSAGEIKRQWAFTCGEGKLGGFTQIVKYNKAKKGCHYVVKDFNKDQSDWDLHTNKQTTQVPKETIIGKHFPL